MVGVEPGEQRRAVGAGQARREALGELEVVRGVPRGDRGALVVVDPRAGELADRLEQQEAALADRLHQARVDEPLEQVEVGARDALGGLERERAGEDRQPQEERLRAPGVSRS